MSKYEIQNSFDFMNKYKYKVLLYIHLKSTNCITRMMSGINYVLLLIIKKLYIYNFKSFKVAAFRKDYFFEMLWFESFDRVGAFE